MHSGFRPSCWSPPPAGHAQQRPEPIISPEIGPDHRVTIRIRALRAGKAVYCEWPLGATLAEAEEMAGPGRRTLTLHGGRVAGP